MLSAVVPVLFFMLPFGYWRVHFNQSVFSLLRFFVSVLCSELQLLWKNAFFYAFVALASVLPPAATFVYIKKNSF